MARPARRQQNLAMRTLRPVSTVLVTAAALALGLGLGSAGTATAAGALTTGVVKKIAVKVVKQQASSLAVAHATSADRAIRADQATSADNATTLGGLTAASLSTTPTVYTITSVGTPGQQKEWPLPQLTPGTYDMRFNAAIKPSLAGATVACGFLDPLNTSNNYALTAATYVSPFVAAWPIGGTVHTIVTGENTSLVCSLTGGTFTLLPDITITITRLNGTTAGTTTLLPRAGAAPGLVSR
jgi:hypothetical protein